MTEDQRRRLFEVYYLCQFGRAVALDLCERAALFNQLVALLTLASVAGSLLAGAVALFAIDALKSYWAILNILAVVLAIWTAIMSYSEKEFEYHMLASNFQGIALEVENFSGYAVYSDTFSASEIDRKATAFHADYSELMGRTRREYKRYGDRHTARIDAELRQRLQAAGFTREADRSRSPDEAQ